MISFYGLLKGGTLENIPMYLKVIWSCKGIGSSEVRITRVIMLKKTPEIYIIKLACQLYLWSKHNNWKKVFTN